MKALWNGLLKFVDICIVILLVAMTLVVAVAVYFRYVLVNPLSWSEEFARYCMIWFAMFGAMVALRDNAHVGVSVVVDLLPAKAKQVVLQFGRVFVIIFLAVIIFYSILHLKGVADQTSSAMQIPMSIPYLSITVGALLMFLVAIRQLFGIDKVKSADEAVLDDVKGGAYISEVDKAALKL